MSLNVRVQWIFQKEHVCVWLWGGRRDTCLLPCCVKRSVNGARDCGRVILMGDTVRVVFFFLPLLLFLVTIVRDRFRQVSVIKVSGTFSFSYWTPSRCAKILIDKCATVPPASLSISVTETWRWSRIAWPCAGTQWRARACDPSVNIITYRSRCRQRPWWRSHRLRRPSYSFSFSGCVYHDEARR